MTSARISDEAATAAYLYGFSIDEAYKFLHETTVAPGLPFNEFQLLRDLADDTYTAHPTINNDTLHLQGWFDVAAEPVVVTIPDHDEGRYWILHTMDLGHYTTAMIGSRTRGTKGGRFLFAARDWDGTTPDGIDEVVRSDSNLIKALMTDSKRLLGTRADLQDEERGIFAEGTYLGQWGLPPVESVYLKIETGSDGEPINGAGGKRYRARFAAPEVSEFWSFTVYGDDDRLMAHNDLNRHSRGDRTLSPDADGHYTIELGADTASNAANPNFLPIPEKNAYIILRLYGPSEAMQDGQYAIPEFTVVD